MPKLPTKYIAIFSLLLLVLVQRSSVAQETEDRERIEQAFEAAQFEHALKLCEAGVKSHPGEVYFWTWP